MPVKPIPDGYQSVTPYLIVNGAAKAIDFYEKAFGATELFRLAAPDGKIVEDVDQWFPRAIAAGAKQIRPVADDAQHKK